MHLRPPYFFVAFAILFAACESDQSGPVDPRGAIPVLRSTSLTPAVVNTDTINIGSERKPDDLLTIPFHAAALLNASSSMTVYAVIRPSGGSDPLAVALLADDGRAPDLVANDSIFAGVVSAQIQRTVVGQFFVSIVAEGPAGDRSTEMIHPVSIVRLNHAPVISGLNAPDSVHPSSTMTQFLITLRAEDADGSADIRTVYRLTPSGKYVPLYDNGNINNGDSRAGDHIYSEIVGLVPPPSAGTYIFQFRAVDRSSDSSNVLTKAIKIY